MWTLPYTAWLLSSMCVVVAGTAARLGPRQSLVNFNWTSIEPSQDLEYHDCYGKYKCARLMVPLDWTHAVPPAAADSSAWAAIGIVTLPAKVPISDPSFGGTVLVNPGGPSGAGTEMVLEQGEYLRSVLDGNKHYEILGFDPRGVGVSTPASRCYTEDVYRLVDAAQQAGMPPAHVSELGLNLFYQAAIGMGRLCGETGPDGIFAHMSTASVARDMLEIVERVESARQTTTNSSVAAAAAPARLQYLGVSYGTFLGNVFASMFPSRVGRMVLDGITDAEDFRNGSLRKNLNDAEAVIDRFYQTCFEAGTNCQLRQVGDKDAAAIRGRVDRLIRALETSPVAVVQDGRVHLVTSRLIRETIRQTLYHPICSYEALSEVLSQSLRDNHTALVSRGPNLCTRPARTYALPECPWCDEAAMGVLCGDSAAAASDRPRSVAWARDLVHFFQKQSPTAGEPWSHNVLACAGWQFRPKFAFGGPFGTPAPGTTANAPAAPLLILANRFDHATPLANAFALSKAHGGSVVVVQESVGHVALLTSTSRCTADIVREYFETGKVPATGTQCPEDCKAGIPFKPCPGLVD